MRKLIYALAPVLLLTLLTGCRRAQKPRAEATEEEAPQLAGAVHMADTRTARQLVSGFYPLEQNAWRWTMGKFSVRLRTPLAAAQKGATLDLRFTALESVIQKLGKMTLSATINGVALKPETFAKPGAAAYTRDVPASAFHSGAEAATVDFALDKALPPSAADNRELGLVVSSISLQAK